ncbi:cob(I)yrinic acid a,c-diamide adenosyltransferase [Patescibacteria group bacterium]
MKIYTKTGDKGKTSLCDGEKVSKSSLRVCAYGDLDELSSAIGFAIAINRARGVKKVLEKVQRDLFLMASHVATCNKDAHDVLPKFDLTKVRELEAVIDDFSEGLPKLHKFLLPGGTKAACAIHMARTVCRRAERTCVQLSEHQYLYEPVLPYLNRLSDILFVLGRVANKGKDKFA